jgi:hypothetical protein
MRQIENVLYQIGVVQFGGLPAAGTYSVLVYDSSDNLLTSGTIYVAARN